MFEAIADQIRDKQWTPLQYDGDISFSWDEYIHIINENFHLSKKNQINKHGRVLIQGIEKARSRPRFVRDILDRMNKFFINNTSSCHIFSGIINDSGSFPIHKDGMDVLYLQVKNTITWKVYPHKDGSRFNTDRDDKKTPPAERSCFSKTLYPGDMMWIPRGTYHQVVTTEPRVGFSFGVEGPTDPCTYI